MTLRRQDRARSRGPLALQAPGEEEHMVNAARRVQRDYRPVRQLCLARLSHCVRLLLRSRSVGVLKGPRYMTGLHDPNGKQTGVAAGFDQLCSVAHGLQVSVYRSIT